MLDLSQPLAPAEPSSPLQLRRSPRKRNVESTVTNISSRSPPAVTRHMPRSPAKTRMPRTAPRSPSPRRRRKPERLAPQTFRSEVVVRKRTLSPLHTKSRSAARSPPRPRYGGTYRRRSPIHAPSRSSPPAAKRNRPEEIRRTVYQNPLEPEKIIGQVARGTVNRAVVCPVTACGQALSKRACIRHPCTWDL